MIKLSGKLICKNAQESDLVKRLLPDHVRLTRNEPGCLAFDVKETADPLVWTVREIFLDQTTFEAHQERTKNSTWGVQSQSIVREYEMSEIAQLPGTH